jgi:hypothetical protein
MRSLAFALALALSIGLCSAKQDDRAAAERSLERFQSYLAQRPFHEQGFERLVGSAVELNALGKLVADLEAKRAAGEATRADLVVLARLHARTDRTTEALATLDTLEGQDADFTRSVTRLRGDLLIDLGRVEDGLALPSSLCMPAARKQRYGSAIANAPPVHSRTFQRPTPRASTSPSMSPSASHERGSWTKPKRSTPRRSHSPAPTLRAGAARWPRSVSSASAATSRDAPSPHTAKRSICSDAVTG